MGFFDSLFKLFEPLTNLLFPRDQFRQADRQRLGAGFRNFSRTAWQHRMLSRAAKQGKSKWGKIRSPEHAMLPSGRLARTGIARASLARPSGRPASHAIPTSVFGARLRAPHAMQRQNRFGSSMFRRPAMRRRI